MNYVTKNQGEVWYNSLLNLMGQILIKVHVCWFFHVNSFDHQLFMINVPEVSMWYNWLP